MKPKITELTPAQKRTICAEACGWTRCACGDTEHCDVWYGPEEYATPTIGVSNYDESLDAMAEAEATLTDDREKEQYVKWLNRIHPVSGVFDADSNTELAREIFHIVSATASQRLDAFLLAKGVAV